MTDKEKNVSFIAIIVLLLLLCASVVFNITQYNDLHNREEKTVTVEKHDTAYIHDTTTIDNPKPVEVKYVDKYIQVPVEVVENETVYASLPKVEKVYKEDSLYECQVSGIEPNLDYIKVFPKTTIITNEKETTTTIIKRPHINWGIQAGVGYGITHKNFDAYVGLGIQYSF